MKTIVFAGRKLIYEREWHNCLFMVGKKKMHLEVEVEDEKIIRHSPQQIKDVDVWNSLTVDDMREIDSILRDEFEL